MKESNKYRDKIAKIMRVVPKKYREEIWNNRSDQCKLLCDLGKLPEEKQQAFLRSLTKQQRNAIYHSWEWLRRPNQKPPPEPWSHWLMLAGRGFGKSRTAKQWLVQQMQDHPGVYAYWSRNTAQCLRDLMGGNGSKDSLIEIIGEKNLQNKDKKNLIIELKNGSIVYGYSGESVDAIRGSNLSGAVYDELCFFADPKGALDITEYALRVGEGKSVITTTPKSTVLGLLKDIMRSPNTVVTRGSSWSNILNLSGTMVEKLLRAGGTLQSRIEIDADLVSLEGLLFRNDYFKIKNVAFDQLERIVVAFDPAISNNDSSNLHGVVVCGTIGEEGYVLDDLSMKGTPAQVCKIISEAYHKYKANEVVYERNNGGLWIESALKTADRTIPVKSVTAKRGKFIRAEPIAQLYERGQIYHTRCFKELCEEMVTFDPNMLSHANSPNRLDALVWAFTQLFYQHKPIGTIGEIDGLVDLFY